MKKLREILRQKLDLGRSHREVAASLGVSVGAVSGALERAKEAGLDWEAAKDVPEEGLEQRLYGRPEGQVLARPLPDWRVVHKELHRKGVTLELLHVEYLESHPDGYQYSRFCELYRVWRKKQRVTMRQVHRAGEKLFVDYAGSKPRVTDPTTGEAEEVELFVSALGASNYTYAEATETQTLGDWIASHVRAFDFMEGVSEVLVCDQLKSGVSKPCRYEPGVHRTYQEMAEFYGTTVIPARPRKPRDKAKVEAAVLVAERWILARLRHQTFFSLAELNARIRELLVELNSREMRAYGASRRELFESLDRPVLRALPRRRFTYGVWSQPKVNIDYHVEVDRHFYSVPHALVHEMVDARTSASVVEIFHRGKRVACHARSPVRGGFTSCAEHMPKSHRKHLEWTPSRLIRWAGRIGPQTQALVTAILEDRPHPEQGYRSCLGIMRLAKRHGAERLEAACARALAADARSYRHVDRILKNGLDRVPLPTLRTVPTRPRSHANLRGARYYGDAKGGSSC